MLDPPRGCATLPPVCHAPAGLLPAACSFGELVCTRTQQSPALEPGWLFVLRYLLDPEACCGVLFLRSFYLKKPPFAELKYGL